MPAATANTRIPNALSRTFRSTIPMSRRHVMVAAAVVICAALATAAEEPRATVAQGVLHGTTDNGVAVFRGVAFAAPPIGDLRWAPPKPAVRWGSQPREATTFGPACTQALHTTASGPWTLEYLAPVEHGTSEDCLSLNIWTPAKL